MLFWELKKEIPTPLFHPTDCIPVAADEVPATTATWRAAMGKGQP
jgi:hypothetical protein